MTPVLEIKDLAVEYCTKKVKIPILSDVSFQVYPGQCVGILGESGSGKSMTVKAAMGLLDRNFIVTGSARYKQKELIGSSKEELRKIRGKEVCMILQNPMTCFDPLCRIGDQMEETYRVHTEMDRKKIYDFSIQVLETMQIQNAAEVLKKYPHQLSGGMLQRIMIGLAMSMKPDILIADEPTTAIDAITQYEIMKEFVQIKKQYDTAMIFISHDLGVISQIADEVIVMNKGRIADRGTFEAITNDATDQYTAMLVENKLKVMEMYRKALTKGR